MCHPRFRTTFCFVPFPAAAVVAAAAATDEAEAIPPGITASVPTPAWLLKYACAPTGTAENASVRSCSKKHDVRCETQCARQAAIGGGGGGNFFTASCYNVTVLV